MLVTFYFESCFLKYISFFDAYVKFTLTILFLLFFIDCRIRLSFATVLALIQLSLGLF